MKTMSKAIEKVTSGEGLEPDLAREAMDKLMSGDAAETNIGALLAGLKAKGESPGEIAAFAETMRHKAVRIDPKVDGELMDMCGTGGASVKTFNISTISTFVVAGAGYPVAKHGNRSNTSRSGSADLLEALGVNLDADPGMVERSIEETGLGFLYAPNHHPAMKHAAGPRSELGIRTVFNLLGPLTNPASADRHLMGVYEPELVEKFPFVLKKLGVSRALVVHGEPGMDEISTAGRTYVGELGNGEIDHYEIKPRDFGLPEVEPSAVGDLPPEESARLTLEVLSGENTGKRRDIVLLNAGAGIYVAGGADSIGEGIEVARKTIYSGRGYRAARELVAMAGNEEKFKDLEREVPGTKTR
ncbi:MAG: anthranilate phosphoribosyltransferase [Candidatus Acetothermia bacterium]